MTNLWDWVNKQTNSRTLYYAKMLRITASKLLIRNLNLL